VISTLWNEVYPSYGNLDITADCYERDIDCSVSFWKMMADEDQVPIENDLHLIEVG